MIKNSLLWCGQHSQWRHIFLFGTAHIYDPELIKSLQQLGKYLVLCDVFLAEANLNILELEKEILFSVTPNIAFMDIQKISDKKWEKLSKMAMKKFKMDISHMRYAGPFSIVQLLESSLLPQGSDCFLDEAIWRLAVQHNLQVEGLEPISSQIRYLHELSRQSQWSDLEKLLNGFSSRKKQIRNILNHYRRQEIVPLYRKSKSSLGKMRRLMIQHRNTQMCRTILDYTSTGRSVFCAVGSAHLPGKYGLLRLLKGQGYKVNALPFDWRSPETSRPEWVE